jgi:hypothetical protein
MHELKRLERCERALADAYKHHGPITGLTEQQLHMLAQRHLEHAKLLRARIRAFGQDPEPESDDSWVTGTDQPGLKFAEYTSLATYHDHLLDFDQTTADAVRDIVIPDHAQALSLLDPTYVRERDGDI